MEDLEYVVRTVEFVFDDYSIVVNVKEYQKSPMDGDKIIEKAHERLKEDGVTYNKDYIEYEEIR